MDRIDALIVQLRVDPTPVESEGLAERKMQTGPTRYIPSHSNPLKSTSLIHIWTILGISPSAKHLAVA